MSAIGSPVFAAGQYTTVWNSLSIGLMEGDQGVPTIDQTDHAEEIRTSDGYAKSLIEAFYQGADYFAQFTVMEYKASVLALLWPFGALGQMGVIGRAFTDLAQALVLTAVAGTPAVTNGAGPNSITASKAILAPNYNARFLLGPMLRKIPLRLSLFPYTSGTNQWFSTT